MYRLCLVTDREILDNKDLYKTIEGAVENGVTMVQLREKNISIDSFVEIGKKLKKITDRLSVPLIINDNVEVARLIDASGVHLGQSDMSIEKARKILGDNKIIGLSVSNLEEAKNSVKEKIDYIGVGPIYATGSKKDAATPMGLAMLKKIKDDYNIPVIAIGGINSLNVEEVIDNGADGVAIISGILAAENPSKKSKEIFDKINKRIFLNKITKNLENIKSKTPLVYHLTNTVTINDCANITLAMGGSPLMSFCLEEMEEIISFASSVIINIGTMEKEMVSMAVEVAKIANRQLKPLILDPVGVGATNARKELIEEILEKSYVDVIKGNLSEIKTILYEVSNSRGVDALDKADINTKDIILNGAKKLGCILAVTGEIDYISDGNKLIEIYNGNKVMEKVSGAGCMINSLIGSSIGANGITLESVSLGVLAMSVCGEIACRGNENKGSGTLKSRIFDEIVSLNGDILKKEEKIKIY
ncbi:hydroxyethylthiazole kinase [uncultured Cetobacterium sp.]|uniref:hydroxyethylthiazole kinase n=1 Tax=uncultured Cetobacterium sp. TaxID=527638 RepID=UPI002612AE1A|nr:hydroxyethylthiazole kinase [uncultured Cetobacterium sp.]